LTQNPPQTATKLTTRPGFSRGARKRDHGKKHNSNREGDMKYHLVHEAKVAEAKIEGHNRWCVFTETMRFACGSKDGATNLMRALNTFCHRVDTINGGHGDLDDRPAENDPMLPKPHKKYRVDMRGTVQIEMAPDQKSAVRETVKRYFPNDAEFALLTAKHGLRHGSKSFRRYRVLFPDDHEFYASCSEWTD
jgi:hypothetical protein